MKLFGKKEGEDSGPDQDNDNQAPQSSSSNSSSTNKDIILLRKDLETLRALVGTLREMKKDDQDRFQKMNEQIGELRNMLFDKEQELKDLRLQVGKSIDLVEQAQVEKVLIEKKKEDARITMLDARVESYKAIADQMMSELKIIRTKIDMYRGVEQVINLNNEVKKNLTNTNLIKADIDRHADMIEGMFINFNKKFDEFRNNRTEVMAMARELQSNIKKVNKLETDMNVFVKKDELDALREQVTEKLRFSDDYKTRFENMLNQMADKSRVSYIDNALARLQTEKTQGVDTLRSGLQDVQNKVMSREVQYQQYANSMNDWLNFVQSRVQYYDAQLAQIMQALQSMGASTGTSSRSRTSRL